MLGTRVMPVDLLGVLGVVRHGNGALDPGGFDAVVPGRATAWNFAMRGATIGSGAAWASSCGVLRDSPRIHGNLIPFGSSSPVDEAVQARW